MSFPLPDVLLSSVLYLACFSASFKTDLQYHFLREVFLDAQLPVHFPHHIYHYAMSMLLFLALSRLAILFVSWFTFLSFSLGHKLHEGQYDVCHVH